MNKIMLRDLNNPEPDNWVKFWKSFEAWLESDALQNGFFNDNKCYFNSSWNGGTYEYNIDFEKEYNIEYGISFPHWTGIHEYEEIKRFVEIAYKRWIKSGKHYDFTVRVNETLNNFELPYRFENGILDKNNVAFEYPTDKEQMIKFAKGDKLYSCFGVYDIGAQIGQGGNSKVYSATDQEGNPVAIKVLRREQGERFARFVNEVQFCYREKHKNIIQIIDFGAVNQDFVFYVMPLAKETLRDRIKRGISPNDAECIFLSIIDGLIYAHEKNVYHRDIKPENVLFMDESNNAIIADFGIAHFEEENLIADVHTKASDRFANFQYAAPEQRIKSGAKLVDGRADIYSTGLILNEMFTGTIVGGINYKKIADVAPEYGYLDDIFEQLYCQNPDDRLFPARRITEEIKTKKETL